MKFTTSEENHIKGIYHLQQHTGLVNTNSLAAEMQTRPASVTDMLKKLKQKKLLQYERYKGFKLSEKGNKTALAVIRKHRLWEFFLVDKLKFEWDEVHSIAEELEHVSSDELILRLDNYLGNPAFDPHGDPIPDQEGNIKQMKQISLTSIEEKETVIVSSVGNQTSQMLEMLNYYNIALGTKLTVLKKFSFDNSLQIKVSKNKPCIISDMVAKNVYVQHEQ